MIKGARFLQRHTERFGAFQPGDSTKMCFLNTQGMFYSHLNANIYIKMFIFNVHNSYTFSGAKYPLLIYASFIYYYSFIMQVSFTVDTGYLTRYWSLLLPKSY